MAYLNFNGSNKLCHVLQNYLPDMIFTILNFQSRFSESFTIPRQLWVFQKIGKYLVTDETYNNQTNVEC